MLEGVDLLGDNVADMIWARPAVTVLGIDCPPVVGSSAVIQPEARALASLRVPPGMDANDAQDGREVTLYGSGGSIPLCNVFQETFPDAEIMLLGVEEPRSLIHAPNESVDPSEIERLALVEALFLLKCGTMTAPRNEWSLP